LNEISLTLSNHLLDTEGVSMDSSIIPASRLAEAQLSRFSLDPMFGAKMQVAFGKDLDLAGAESLQKAWAGGDFAIIPPIRLLSGAEIGNAEAAFRLRRIRSMSQRHFWSEMLKTQILLLML